jgi:hypothetical protein
MEKASGEPFPGHSEKERKEQHWKKEDPRSSLALMMFEIEAMTDEFALLAPRSIPSVCVLPANGTPHLK